METYPLPKFHFLVEWNASKYGFTEVTGLDFQVEPIEFRHGNSREFSKIKMPGMQKYSNLTLKRGTFAGNFDFYNWVNTVSMTKVERRDLTISLLNEEGKPLMSWKIKNAFPIKWQPSDAKSDGNEVAIETLEIAHEGMTIAGK